MITTNFNEFKAKLDTIKNAFNEGNSIDLNLNVISGSINNKKVNFLKICTLGYYNPPVHARADLIVQVLFKETCHYMKSLEKSEIDTISSIFTELSRKSNNIYETDPNNSLNQKFHNTTEALLMLFKSSQNLKKDTENLTKVNTLQIELIKIKVNELKNQEEKIKSLKEKIDNSTKVSDDQERKIVLLEKENRSQQDTIEEKFLELKKQKETIESLNEQIDELKKETENLKIKKCTHNDKSSETKLKINNEKDDDFKFNNEGGFHVFYQKKIPLKKINLSLLNK